MPVTGGHEGAGQHDRPPSFTMSCDGRLESSYTKEKERYYGVLPANNFKSWQQLGKQHLAATKWTDYWNYQLPNKGKGKYVNKAQFRRKMNACIFLRLDTNRRVFFHLLKQLGNSSRNFRQPNKPWAIVCVCKTIMNNRVLLCKPHWQK